MHPHRWIQPLLICCWAPLMSAAYSAHAAEPLPFNHKVEVYRDKDGQTLAFALHLEQPFLAEEFEKSNYLRLAPLDANAYLIYPSETRFHERHAEFYGRFRSPNSVAVGSGLNKASSAKVRLSYETVSENLDGSRRVDVRQGEIEIPIPAEATGSQAVFRQWAGEQNVHFRDLLSLYPEQSYFQYVLLQSRQRYGVEPPTLPVPLPQRADVESDLYDVASGSLAVHEALQRWSFDGSRRPSALNVPIDRVSPATVASLPYAQLLEERKTRDHALPKRHALAKLVPADQYFLHFHSATAAGEMLDLASDWGENLLRLFTITAQDNRLQTKLEEQLCFERDGLTRLFADGVVSELAVTGSDPFVLEGTDVTLILRLKQPALFQHAADGWLASARKKFPELVERQFNYRGHKVSARYTPDRLVSSFVAVENDCVIYSNSHRAIRSVLDAATGAAPTLYDAPDYGYVTTILPPSDDPRTGYLYVSEAFVRRMVSPAAKIAEKRRLECFNNLVMLNNASLMYRMEYGKSPASLSDLVESHFVDPAQVVCQHGGAYAFDAAHDTCTCSLHNRLKYLTPNCELAVENVSSAEQQEYARYKQRYEELWQTFSDPMAVRITVGRRVKLETCILPLAGNGLYATLRQQLGGRAQPTDTAGFASSAVVSCVAAPGRQAIADLVRGLPGVPETLEAEPTLADLKWLGERASFHLCDEDTLLEIDPTRLKSLDLPLVNHVNLDTQALVSTLLAVATMPSYVSIEVGDREKAARLLEQLAKKYFRQGGSTFGLPHQLDAYRLPDYKGTAQYVFSYQIYAVKLRLHVAVVGNQIVAATKPHVLRQVIDAAASPPSAEQTPAQLFVRLNRRGLDRLESQLELYWGEKSRLACHRNAIALYNLVKLYNVPIDEAQRLAESKYGVRYFCPDHGRYEYDAARDEVVCSVHGNRGHSRQELRLDEEGSFAHFINSLDEVTAALRFEDQALLATVEIVRSADGQVK